MAAAAALAVVVATAVSTPGVTAALMCPGLCPNETSMEFPDRAYNWSMLSSTVTCAEWDQDSRVSYTNEQGEEKCPTDDNGFWIDMASYCGCTGYEQRFSCDFCPSGNVTNPDTLVTAPEGSNLDFSLTCEQASVATQYVSSEEVCLVLKLQFAPACCDSGVEDGGQNEASAASSCSICPPGSEMGNPDRSLFFIGEGLTCRNGQDILDNLQSDPDSCALARERFDRLPINLAAWCECSGTGISSDSCAFCNHDAESALLSSRRDREVDLGGNLTVTCEEAEVLAPFMGSGGSGTCEDPAFLVAVQECGSDFLGAPATASGESHSTTPAPTFAISEATKSAQRRVSTALSSLVAFWVLLAV